jgi:tRNA 2-thiouridine synthesizing protein A
MMAHSAERHTDSSERQMQDKTLNLRGLKCPLPALRTRKALAGMAKGEVLVVECTDPLASIDIPNLLNQTGDTLEGTAREKKVISFRIRKK